jgi:hypothetical protein
MPVDVASWYDANPDQTSLYQGDVLDDIPLIFIPPKISKWIILRPNLKGALTDVDVILGGKIPKWFTANTEGSVKDAWTLGDKEEYVAAKAKKMRVMIVTQTCDLVQRSFYQVAPVFPSTTLTDADKENLKLHNFNYMFYVPAQGEIKEDSFADLSQITDVPKTYFKANKVLARLSASTTLEFQMQVAEFYGRPFGFNVRDRSPHTAEFACVRCFYEQFRLQKKPVIQGERFPQCDACGDGLWVRISDAIQTTLEFATNPEKPYPIKAPTGFAVAIDEDEKPKS